MKRFAIIVLILLLLASGAAAGYWYFKYDELSARFAQTLYRSKVTVDDVVIPNGMTYVEEEGRLFLDIRIVQGWLDEGAYVSPSGERLYMKFEAMGFKSGDDVTDALLSESLETLSLPIYRVDDQRYVELEALSRLYRMRWMRSPESGMLNLLTHRADVVNLKVSKGAVVSLDGIKVFEVQPNQFVTAVRTEGGALNVLHADGRMGLLERLDGIETSPANFLPPVIPVGDRAQLDRVVGAWDQVHSYENNFNFNAADGFGTLNVIMPTWFDLNVDGIVLSLADMSYVLRAQEAGIQVWGLYANHFSPAWTSEMLRSEALSDRTIAHVVAYAVAFGLEGINIDFENMYLKDQALFSDYVAKLSEALKRVGKWVSIDVTVPEGSDQWSKVYDRPALSKSVDFVFLMAYDEHWASSPKAGSVASRDWVVTGIEKSLALIPREKLVLGMPLYTRIWKESGTGGAKKVSSSTLSYARTSEWLEARSLMPVFDEETGQNYVEYVSNGVKYRVWLEDAASLEMRLELMERYGLPGLGFWSIDFANEEVWAVIESD
ncbi:glycosyl hydrolase family 18 protein [Acidaminobacter hydrogenoformans]|uniref:Glycosyl hydrolases family 18 n=1 Tax=Acidaminobacter hydrogenoformans DSM 2784 TaxID=1120920 RepID=A0A1G5S2V8_9FIRM|nr:glycosyl hydrolase family 18 protein [Acidaminobacter hydrogenoformans]SCZ80715.1 Glycosyl hydrolases family 18 [Acidaminobacter hydrogenoformans DSM 2784]